MEPVVAHPDPPADTHPVQHQRKHHDLPGRVEQRDHREGMKDDECYRRDPTDLVPATEVELIDAHGVSSDKVADGTTPQRTSPAYQAIPPRRRLPL